MPALAPRAPAAPAPPTRRNQNESARPGSAGPGASRPGAAGLGSPRPGSPRLGSAGPGPKPAPPARPKPAPPATRKLRAPRKDAEHEILFQKYFKSVNPQRTYASQVKKAGNGNQYVVITEGKRDDATAEVRKTRVFVYSEDFVEFFRMLQETAHFLRDNPVPEDVRQKRHRFWSRKAEPSKTSPDAPTAAAPRLASGRASAAASGGASAAASGRAPDQPPKPAEARQQPAPQAPPTSPTKPQGR